MNSSQERKLVTIYLPLLLFLTGFIWKLLFINHRDISLDEPFTIFNAQRSVAEILKIPAQGEPNPPLFMLLMHCWIKVFGISPLSVRFLPLLFNALTIPFLYFTAKRSFGLWAGIAASGLFILSTFHFFHGLEARTYSLFSLATASSLYFFLELSRNANSFKTLTGLVVSNAVLVYAHYFGWFVIACQFVSSLLYVRDTKVFFRMMAAQAITVILFIPMIPLVVSQFKISSQGTWVNPPGPHEFTGQIHAFLNHRDVYRLILWMVAAGVALFLFNLIMKKATKPPPGLLVPFIWWLVPYTVMFYVSSFIPMFNSRYVLFTTIGLFVAVGALYEWLFRGNRYLIALSVLLLLFVMFSRMKVLPDDFGRRSWKDVAAYARTQANDTSVIVLFPKWSDVMFAYHYDRKLFQDYKNFGYNTEKKRIIGAWGIHHVRSVTEANKGKRLLYIQDTAPNPGENVTGMLDSSYRLTEHRRFPEMIDVYVYDTR